MPVQNFRVSNDTRLFVLEESGFQALKLKYILADWELSIMIIEQISVNMVMCIIHTSLLKYGIRLSSNEVAP